MRQGCLLLVLLLFTLHPAHAGHKPPQIFLRVHIQTSGEGQSSQQATSITIPPNGESILVRSLPEVSEHDLIDAQVDGSGTLHLRFDHAGQVALSAATAQNQGRILVVLINGYVIYAPTIDEQITSGELDIPHPISSQALLQLQEVAQKNVKQANRT